MSDWFAQIADVIKLRNPTHFSVAFKKDDQTGWCGRPVFLLPREKGLVGTFSLRFGGAKISV